MYIGLPAIVHGTLKIASDQELQEFFENEADGDPQKLAALKEKYAGMPMLPHTAYVAITAIAAVIGYRTPKHWVSGTDPVHPYPDKCEIVHELPITYVYATGIPNPIEAIGTLDDVMSNIVNARLQMAEVAKAQRNGGGGIVQARALPPGMDPKTGRLLLQ